jgi:hypothetical protein
MDDVSRDDSGGSCRKAFVGHLGATRPPNQNSHPLIKIDSPIVISIWGARGPNQKLLLKLRFWQVSPTEAI